jgi:hypothetical protein
MTSVLLLVAALTGAADPVIGPPLSPSPAEQLRSYKRQWGPGGSTCADGKIPLPSTADAAREVLWARRGELSSVCLMELAALWSGDDTPRAERLFMTGRVRYRYDKMRCVDPKANSVYDSLHTLAAEDFAQMVVAGRTPGAPLVDAKLLARQMAEDPATLQTAPPPAQACESGGGVIPESKWPEQAADIRRRLLDGN